MLEGIFQGGRIRQGFALLAAWAGNFELALTPAMIHEGQLTRRESLRKRRTLKASPKRPQSAALQSKSLPDAVRWLKL